MMDSTNSSGIHLGTSAFVADGWETSFYPKGMKPADYLSYYATKFDTVEIDATFYHPPSAATVNGWARARRFYLCGQSAPGDHA
jgi:uncharacterized protein YecE (DUF72 family)